VPENDVNGLAKLGEDILTFDVSDDALERAAAVADGEAVTVGYCTHWYTCSWPQVIQSRRRSAAKLLTKDAAPRIAANIAKLPALLKRER